MKFKTKNIMNYIIITFLVKLMVELETLKKYIHSLKELTSSIDLPEVIGLSKINFPEIE